MNSTIQRDKYSHIVSFNQLNPFEKCEVEVLSKVGDSTNQ